MAQQTAVGWLIMQLPVKIRVELYEKNIHEQALQMEKEQMSRAWDNGYKSCGKDIIADTRSIFENYYEIL